MELPAVRNVASQQAWSCQRRTPRPCRCISLRSAARWRQAVTPLSSSMAPATILLPRLRSPKTSLWCACHPMLPNSTRSKTSGNICAATNSPSPSSTTTTTSLIKPATHGTSLNKIQCASPQSPPEHGRLSMIRAVGMRSFTIYVDDREVYAKEIADALEADLQPLATSGLITRISKYDTNPANNPQSPQRPRERS